MMQNEKGQILCYFCPKGQILVFFPLCEFPGIGKFTETDGYQDLGRADGKLFLIGYRVSVWVDKKVLENSGDGCSIL